MADAAGLPEHEGLAEAFYQKIAEAAAGIVDAEFALAEVYESVDEKRAVGEDAVGRDDEGQEQEARNHGRAFFTSSRIRGTNSKRSPTRP